ncbi:hypothetical protein [Pseudomonas citronellolis]|uniref:hypothetical protein n=1 Tax=Pseudomonas citronellolis TaxID=53408 RepID=UPI002FD8EAA2
MANEPKRQKEGVNYVKAGESTSSEAKQTAPVVVSYCRCTGKEVTTLNGYDSIPSYRGDLPSPLQIIWYAPKGEDLLRTRFSDTEIRSWIKDAAHYHGIPHLLLAVILQQENGPGASTTLQALQFGERSLTTFLAIVDEVAFDIVPDKVAGSSSGFVNMSRKTLRDAATYTESYYCKKPMPKDVQYRIFGFDQDTRIPGDDWKADLYYAAAHLRQLIDRITATPCHSGPLAPDKLKAVIGAYNGSGPLAEKYASDAMALLERAKTGASPLYFYER